MIKTIFCAVLTTFALGACSTTPAWKTAEAAAPLTIPAGVDTPGTSNELVVPNAADAGEDENLLRTTRPPTTNQAMTLAEPPDAAFKDVGSVLSEANVGKIVASDPTAHTYSLVLTAAQVQPEHRSFTERLFHRSPDAKGTHKADVTLVGDGKGRSNVVIDGDDLAVQRIYKILKTSSTSSGSVSADADADADSKDNADASKNP